MDESFRERLGAIRARVAAACARGGRDARTITIIAVTKRHSADVLEEVLAAGVMDLGENRVQELLEKLPAFETRARFHLIGQLQNNKVNKVVGRVAAIHSVDRIELLNRIERRAAELCLHQRIFLQVNVSDEAQKGGCAPDDARGLWDSALVAEHVEPIGLMTMAAEGLGEASTRRQFARLRQLGSGLLRRDGQPPALSMGMSADFEWALAEGATHLRLGTVLVGPRPA
jgi:pyridoxal phosphate enzyme (YggS family)